MIYSMTGFASQSQEISGALLCIDLRSINHRYFDLQMRVPEELRLHEFSFREMLAKRLHRGKIECKMTLQNQQTQAAHKLSLNLEMLHEVLKVSAELENHITDASKHPPLSLHELLRWPGMLQSEHLDADELFKTTMTLLDQALSQLSETRAREGEKLKDFLLERLDKIDEMVSDIAPKLHEITQNWRQRLSMRLYEALENKVDNERLKQEFVFFAQKIDIEEEISRIQSHCKEIRHILQKGGLVGKKLDFFMQELNREANTLGSKSVSTETTRISVELKVLIEQMREQIQNIE